MARELLAELLGTAVLVLLGSAAAAQTVLSLHHHGGQMSSRYRGRLLFSVALVYPAAWAGGWA